MIILEKNWKLCYYVDVIKNYLLNFITMLHIIAQYKQLFISFVMNTETWSHEWISASNAAEKKEGITDQNIKLDKYNDFIMNFDIKKDQNDKSKVLDLQTKLNDLNIKGENWENLVVDWIFWKNTLSAIEVAKWILIKHSFEKKPVLIETQRETQDLSQALPEEKPLTTVKLEEPKQNDEPVKTKEVTDSNLKWLWITWYKAIDWKELRWLVNSKSLDKILLWSWKDISTLFSKISEIAANNNLVTKVNKDWKKENVYSLTPLNISELKKEFIKNWYKARTSLIDWGFWWEEMGALFQILENVIKTQKLIPTLGLEDKRKIVMDYNADWALDNLVHFNVKEKQFFDAVKDEKQFSNLLANLGYNWDDDFNKQFGENYFAAREEFKTRLGSILSIKPPIDPSEMLNSTNWVREYSQLMTEINNQVSEVVDNHDRLEWFSKETKELVKLDTIWVIVWSSFWAWVSFDIKGLTNKLLDNAFIWYVAGVPWIGISRHIIKTKNGWFELGVWVVNLVPFVYSSATLVEWELDEENFKKLFPEELDAATDVVVWGAASAVLQSVMLNVKRVDEKTKEWIDLAKEKMSNVLDNVFKNIKDWKSFEKSDFSSEKSNKIIYERLSDLYNNSWLDIEFIKEGTINNYERVLYENADGLNFAWIWLWLAFVSWYMPIPMILVHWVYNSTEWNEVEPITIEQLKTILGKKSEEKKSENIDKWNIVQSSIEKFNDLNLKQFERGFSYKTRYNKWAHDFMEPSNTLDIRWEWLKRLASSAESLRINVWLPDFLQTINENDIEKKWIIVSTLTQYMKKANYFDNGSIESWNTKTEEFVDIDRKRRWNFDTMFGFSLQEEANEYYRQILEWKWNISKTEIMWLWFDAAASISVEWKKVSWVDTLYTKLDILLVDGKPLLIPINNKEKIDAFTKTLEKLNIYWTADDKAKLIEWIKSWDIELYFYKDSNWFDDRILLIKKGTPLMSAWSIQVFQQTFSSVEVWLWAGLRTEKKDWGNWNNWDNWDNWDNWSWTSTWWSWNADNTADWWGGESF